MALGTAAEFVPEPVLTKVAGGVRIARAIEVARGVRQANTGTPTNTMLGNVIQSGGLSNSPEQCQEYEANALLIRLYRREREEYDRVAGSLRG